MPGKMTILDRLVRQGTIKPKSAIVDKMMLEDPLQYGLRSRQLRSHTGVLPSIESQRKMYQRGLDVPYKKKWNELDEARTDAEYHLERITDQYGDDFATAQDALADDMADWARNQLSYEYTAPDEIGSVVENEMPRYNLEDYWDGEYSPSEYRDMLDEANEARDVAADAIYDWERYGRQKLQTQSPHYRNYQRAMEERAANKRMGHQLSRMWGDAYNRLRARGLNDMEARMYLREYFGGR